MKRITGWWNRWKRARILKETMHGLTLNSVGPLYGVFRFQGENNRDYERRILKAVRKNDKVWIFSKGGVETEIRERNGKDERVRTYENGT